MEKYIEINDDYKTEVEWDNDSIRIFQWDEEEGSHDMILISSEDHARSVIKAITYASKEKGWEV